MRRFIVVLFSFIFCVLSALLIDSKNASACGAFAASPTEQGLAASLPFLKVEQVLLVWDKETETEDFIREARFDRAGQPFGFVVPTPAKPEVSAVKTAPFDALRKDYPFDAPPPPNTKGLGGLGGGASGAGAANPPVVVLTKQRIGSFTAFTLSASDAGAFDKWLHDNGFAMTPEATPWIAHYVALKFFFVAFRYDAKRGAADAGTIGEMTSETVRIRFKTPNAYYPYMEPTHPPNTALPSQRMLTGWLVTRDAVKAVAHRTPYSENSVTNNGSWQRPWSDGAEYHASTDALAKSLSDDLRSLLPKSDSLVVQTFRDLKTSRAAFGDVVFVPATPKPLTSAEAEARKSLVPVIDPTLLDPNDVADDAAAPTAATTTTPTATATATATATPTPAPSASASAPPTKSGGCAMSAARSTTPFGIALISLVFVGFARRRGRAMAALLLFVGVTACQPTSSKSIDDSGGAVVDAANAVVPSPKRHVQPATREEREKVALMILGGQDPPGGIENDVQPGALHAKGDVRITGMVGAELPVEVARILSGLRARFRNCYNAGLNSDPSMEGKLVIEMTIAATGEVTDARPVSNTGLSAAVTTCCTNTVHRAQFNAAPPTKVSFAASFIQTKD